MLLPKILSLKVSSGTHEVIFLTSYSGETEAGGFLVPSQLCTPVSWLGPHFQLAGT